MISTDIYNNQENANQLTRNTYLNDDVTDIIRTELKDAKHTTNKYPKILVKDTLSANTIGTSELHAFLPDTDQPYKSYSDTNVSQFPTFYTSDIKNELTNVGKFFDKKHKYVDTTRSSSSAYIDDNCYIDGNNEITCVDNTRLHNIPTKSTEVFSQCEAMKDSGNYKLDKSTESVSTGLSFYDSVFASSKMNETFSSFSGGPIIRECFDDTQS
jgi:hypothetical protein